MVSWPRSLYAVFGITVVYPRLDRLALSARPLDRREAAPNGLESFSLGGETASLGISSLIFRLN